MIINKSIHFPDASEQIASNGTRILNRGARKWDIKKTLVYVYPNGMHFPVWLDSEGNYVYYNTGTVGGAYPVIGELEYASEKFELNWR